MTAGNRSILLFGNVLKALLLGTMLGVPASASTQSFPGNCTAFEPKHLELKRVPAIGWVAVAGTGGPVIAELGNDRTQAERRLKDITRDLVLQEADHVCLSGPLKYFVNLFGKPTIVVVVRHAEKRDSTDQSPLTLVGECRAETLARMLGPSDISVVMASALPRTQQTIDNYAASSTPPLVPQIYETPASAVESIRTQHKGKKVLVASHSGLVEQIVEGLGAPRPEPIGDQFHNAFVVFIPRIGRVAVLRTRYEIWERACDIRTP